MPALETGGVSVGFAPHSTEEPTHEGFRDVLMRWYAVVLLSIFVVTSLVYSINTSKVEEGAVTPTITGPGGKPLPVNKRRRHPQESREPWFGKNLRLPDVGPSTKRAFRLLSLMVFFVFVVNATTIGIHAWKANIGTSAGEVVWWCGEPMVVSHHSLEVPPHWRLSYLWS
jgi:ATP-binding cassette, subfamily B, vacuolar membrane transporter HMT1/ACLQ